MKQLILTNGLIALVDDEDFNFVNQFRWHPSRGYATSKIFGKSIRLHRLVCGAKPGDVLDHINHNKLDCQKSNLRVCLQKENARNAKGKSRNKVTGVYKGSYWNPNIKKWVASIMFERKSIHLGCFDSEKDAALAYDRAAEKYFGEFACLNFPDEKTTPKENRTVLRSMNKTGFRGVEKRGKKFMAYAGKRSLGTFDLPVEAAIAYDNKVKELYGNKAVLNNAVLF